MRMDTTARRDRGRVAGTRQRADELTRVIRDYGEERFAVHRLQRRLWLAARTGGRHQTHRRACRCRGGRDPRQEPRAMRPASGDAHFSGCSDSRQSRA
ncbi:MAG: hypothetical protein MZV64_48730 [Ignavibacteriales bacterium]|nr:hypothetical protein [Ignavibacteriales bacterium]